MKADRRLTSLAVATITSLLAVGCVDSGLPDKNLPLEEAESREWSYPVYAAAAVAETSFEHEGSAWVVAGAPVRAPARLFVDVGTAEGRSVYALSTDEEPYDRLWLESDAGWSPFARVE